ncbi:MAG: 3-hydroxyisobutyrate dehydrogenase, partial [Betaproteobacteria bacterium]
MKLGFIGLGVMGGPIAAHLLRAGYDVTVYNRTRSKAQAWVSKHGGRAVSTPRETAAGAAIVFSCVGNDDDVRAVTLGDDGAFAGMQRAGIFVDHTTASADVAVELAAAA